MTVQYFAHDLTLKISAKDLRMGDRIITAPGLIDEVASVTLEVPRAAVRLTFIPRGEYVTCPHVVDVTDVYSLVS